MKNLHSEAKTKTVISQISDIVSSFIRQLKELRSGIIYAYKETVSSPALYNTRNPISRRLLKAMEASGFQTIEEKKEFLQAFYDKIDHDLKEIEILPQSQEQQQQQKFYLASKLLVDVMHKKAKWLVRHPSLERRNDSGNKNGSSKIVRASKKNDNEFSEGKWYFEDHKYQEFLDWWFEVHSHPEKLDDFYKSKETLKAKTKIESEFYMYQNTETQQSDSSSNET
jgi:hypothetical protein